MSLEPEKIKTIKVSVLYRILGLIALLLMKQPDLGTTVAIAGTAFVCLLLWEREFLI